MARLIYGCSGAEVIARRIDGNGDALYLQLDVTYDAYTARTGGTQVTDLLDLSDTPMSSITPDEAGVRFQGPDGTTAGLWLENQAAPTEPRWVVEPAGQDLVQTVADMTALVADLSAEVAAFSALVAGFGNVLTGNGDPEGVITSGVGGLWLREDGDIGTTLYVKQTGSGNTGWDAFGGYGQ